MKPENNTTSQPFLQANESLNQPVESAGSSGAATSGASFGLTNFNAPSSTPPGEKPPKRPFLSRRVIVIISLVLLTALAVAAIIFGLWRLSRLRQQVDEKTKPADKYSQQSIALDGQSQATTTTSTILSSSQQVDINGSLQISGSLRLVPTARPANPIPGQQYIDATDNKLYLYDGSQWIAQLNVIDLNAINANVQNLQVQNASITNLANQANSTAASAANAPLPSTVTLQGNSFNSADQLVQLNGSGALPSLDGSLLTNVDAISLQGNGASYYTNAGNISSGTLSDSRLSGNVALLNAANIFSGNNSFTGTIQATNIQTTSSLSVGSSSAALTLQGSSASSWVVNGGGFSTTIGFAGVPSTNVVYQFDRTPASSGPFFVCTTANNCAGLGGSVSTAGGTTNKIAKFSGAQSIVDSSITDTGSGVGIGVGSPGYALDVNGDVNVTNGNAFRIGGTAICTTGGCAAAAGSGYYIQNGASLQVGANFNFESASINSVAGIIKGKSGQISDLLQLQNGAGTTVVSFGATGNTLIKPSTNSPAAFAVQNVANSSVLAVDTQTSRVAVGQANANYTLDVAGDVNTSSQYLINGIPICSAGGCTASGGSGNYIQNGTSLQANSNFHIQSAADGSVTAAIQARASQTAHLTDWQNSGGTPIAYVDASGNFSTTGQYQVNGVQISSANLSNDANLAKLSANNTFTGTFLQQNASNSMAAFQIQDSLGTSNLFVADTQYTRIGIGKATPSYTLDVNGDTNLAAASKLYIGGVAICDINGCGSAPGGSGYIQNVGTGASQQTGNFNIKPTNASVVGGIIQANVSQTANLLETRDSSGTALVAAGATNSLALSVNGDLTIKGKTDAVDSDYVRSIATTSLGIPNILTGTYTCNASGICTSSYGTGGSAGIVPLPSGWGTPTYVLAAKATNNSPTNLNTIRTAAMPATKSKNLGSDIGLDVNGITAMSSDQFTVAANLRSNVGTYTYTAVRADGGGSYDNYFTYGTYTGNGSDNQYVCLSGSNPQSSSTCSSNPSWTPDYVMVIKDNTPTNSLAWYRTSDMTGDASLPMGGAGLTADHIQAFGSGSFQIGANSDVNQNGKPYYWIGFKKLSGYIDVGTYTGNGTSQAINTTSSFRPSMVMTKADYFGGGTDVWQASLWTSGFTGGNATSVFGTQGTTIITGSHGTGFDLGSHTYSNGSGLNYYYFALGGFTSTANVTGYSAGAVYNGRFYTGTKLSYSAEAYCYTGGGSYSKISSNIAGKIDGTEDNADVNQISSMKVFDGKLFVGTDTGSGGGKGALYTYTGNGCGTSGWTALNGSPNRGKFGSDTGIDGISSMSVVNGQLYVATSKSGAAAVYRYNGGSNYSTSFTRVNYALGQMTSGDAASSVSSVKLVNFAGQLYAGTKTSDSAGLYRYDGDAGWVKINNTLGKFVSTANIDEISALTVFNGSLILGTADSTANMAEIYAYTGPQGGGVDTPSPTSFRKISNSTTGVIDSGTARVDRIGSLAVYQGYLLAGSDNNTSDANAAIYRFDGISNWSLLCTNGTNCPEGKMGGQSGIDGVLFLQVYNDQIWAGSNQSAAGALFSFSRNDLTSYGLKFVGSSDGSYDNIGSFSFQSGSQGTGAANNTGQFLLSHTLTTAAGAYDIAEDYQTRDDELEAGDVTAIDPAGGSGFVRRANVGQGDDRRLLGIISTHPAFHLSQPQNYDAAAGSRTVPVALAGRVPVKIDPDSESIAPGDYLTASSKPGMATKTTQTGAVIAKALEGWQKDSGKSTVEVFVSNTFLLPGGQALLSQSTTEQIISSGKPITIFDAFLATADNSLQVLKDLNIFGNTFFKGNTDFAGRQTYHDKDSAGHAVLNKGQQQVEIKFDKSYDQAPIISVTPLSYIRYKIVNKTKDGFTIQVQDEIQDKVDFDWTAVNLIDPKTFESPVPMPN